MNGKVGTESNVEGYIYNKCQGYKEGIPATLVSDRTVDIVDQDKMETNRYGYI